jgi:molybdenum cofactor biosynthesis protein MoaC
MISISHKTETWRQATAAGSLFLRPETLQLVKENRVPKGNVLEAARVAGILAAKKTPDWIPHCHPLPIEGCRIDFILREDQIKIAATVETVAKTGVEMEALTAVSAAALTLYDMLKPVDDSLVISGIALLEKKGGKSQYRENLPADFRAAVIVTSDGTHAGARQDKSGKLIVERLRSLGIRDIDYLILPDEEKQIEKALREFCDKGYRLVATTGGSGLGPRDVTVEATRKVIEREVPGAAEAMRGYGQRRTPYAMLSRGLVGVRGKTFIVNFPGSSRGTEESMNAVFPALFHGYGMMNGGGH